MKGTYDPSVDAAYIYLADEIREGQVAKTVPLDPGAIHGEINLDFDADVSPSPPAQAASSSPEVRPMTVSVRAVVVNWRSMSIPGCERSTSIYEAGYSLAPASLRPVLPLGGSNRHPVEASAPRRPRTAAALVRWNIRT